MPTSHPDAGGYRHEAMVYRGADEFVTRAADFVREGLAGGEPVMVAVAAPRLERLREALGADADRVVLSDMGDLGANPARIIPAWQEFVSEHAAPGRRVRGIGEPIWAGRRPEEIEESQLHEALLNLAIDPDTPLWLICPYDADALPVEVVEEAACSHPAVVQDGDLRGSRSYGGVHHATAMFSTPLPDPPLGAAEVAFGRDDLARVRRAVVDLAAAAGLDEERAADLALVATELATNSVRHGGGGGVLRWWEQPGSLVVEVRDAGRIHDLLVGRRRPEPDAVGGRGVWLAHQLTDLVRIRSTDDGVVVRVLAHR